MAPDPFGLLQRLQGRGEVKEVLETLPWIGSFLNCGEGDSPG